MCKFNQLEFKSDEALQKSMAGQASVNAGWIQYTNIIIKLGFDPSELRVVAVKG